MAFFSLRTEAAGCPYTFTSIYWTCHIPEDSNINIDHNENLNLLSHVVGVCVYRIWPQIIKVMPIKKLTWNMMYTLFDVN
jgi:hypothetical protein